jgi:hypothetical protein
METVQSAASRGPVLNKAKKSINQQSISFIQEIYREITDHSVMQIKPNINKF